MTPGMMMRTRANILIKVNVTCVRDARVTLQQLMATTNAARDKESKRRSWAACRERWCTGGKVQKPLTHSQDAHDFDERHGREARAEERLHHVATESQGHVGHHGRPGNATL